LAHPAVGNLFQKKKFKQPVLLSVASERQKMKTKKLPPIHPGKILLEEFLEPVGYLNIA